MPRLQSRIALALIAFAAAGLVATQFTRAQRSGIDTYAITNARIVPLSGPTLERGTVVIRDGLIAAVGANVSVPADARVIDGSGLTVYPGLFDSNTSLGIPAALTVTDGFSERRRLRWTTTASTDAHGPQLFATCRPTTGSNGRGFH